MIKTISIEKICIYSNSKVLFGVTTSSLNEFGITKYTKIFLNGEEASMEQIFSFFRRNKKNIAEIIQNGLLLDSINFMAIQ